MYDINMKNVKKGNHFFLIFFVVGVFFFILMGGIIISSYVKLNSLDSETTSRDVKIKSYVNDEGTTMYSPIYYYRVNGVEYTCGSNASSNINPGTQNKTVYYDSKNPSNCMTEYSKSANTIFLPFMLIPIICIAVSVINFRKINKRVKIIEKLNQKGKLIKNLPYRLEDTGMRINGAAIHRPVVDYVLPSGSTVVLYGDPRHDGRSFDADGMVDLVIDENNPENYYIDFEINRLSGNLPQDYSSQSQGNQTIQNQQSFQTDPTTQSQQSFQTNPIPQNQQLVQENSYNQAVYQQPEQQNSNTTNTPPN